MGWTRLMPVDTVPVGEARAVRVGLEDLLVCRIADDEARVVENTCSHADLPLGDQQLDGRCVTCPAHGAKFDIDSGATLGPPAPVGIAAYAARIRDGWVEADLDA